jgi:RNA polymerase sigma factor (sigma-70 family)
MTRVPECDEFARALATARDHDLPALGGLLEACRHFLAKQVRARLQRRLWRFQEDLVQEAFLQAVRDFRQFRGMKQGDLQGWLKAILAHTIIDFVRGEVKSGGANAVPTRTRARPRRERAEGPSAQEQALNRDASRRLCEMVGGLPARYRAAILLRFLGGEPYARIGHSMGCSTAAARHLVDRGIRELKARFPAR